MICVSCKTAEATFDSYLCPKCASEFGISSNGVRNSYSQIFNVAKEYLATAKIDGKDGNQSAQVLFTSPAVSFHNARRLHYFIRLLQKIEGIGGSIVECGVEHGRSLLYLATIVYDTQPRHIWGFDSFVGPKEVVIEDTTDGLMCTDPEPGYDRLLRQLLGVLSGYGLPAIWINSNITFVTGFFENSLGRYDGKPIAFLHLDCNFHNSYQTCFDYFYPLMPNGAIIALDEYVGSFDLLHFPGAKIAADEFCAKTGEAIQRDPRYGKCYIVVSKK